MSETIKVVMEIPKETYLEIRDGLSVRNAIASAEAIKNGKPLSEVLAEIRAEIKQFREDLAEKAPSLKDLINAQRTVDICLGIIDEHISGEGANE